ncbi:hypothetical protein ABMA27_009764 [Loxostege sticticalis]|uniref:Mutant cadherin n=1 Tax=Loxostege sticticalis TaxID=481309 RepID=A0ABR3H6D5_LOXSC
MAKQLVANELLAFLQQKLDVMDEVSAVQICASNFSEADISEAKKLLFASLNKSDQMISRRRDGTKKSIQDIITLFKETDPDDAPTFVARDLHKLPPVTFDHVDVTSLLKDIVFLKASLANVTLKFEASQNTISELRKEVDQLRSALITPADDATNINKSRRVSLDKSGSSVESAVLTTPLPTVSQVGQPSSPCVTAPAPRTPASSSPCVHVGAKRNFADVVASKRPSTNPQPVIAVKPAETDFIEVKKRRRPRVSQNRCGTAPTATGRNFQLRAATPVTALYLSRLHYTTQSQDIIEHIKFKTNLELRVSLLESRHNTSFKAFVVLVPTTMLETFLKEEFWPKGVVFRRFRGRLPENTTRAAPTKKP